MSFLEEQDHKRDESKTDEADSVDQSLTDTKYDIEISAEVE